MPNSVIRNYIIKLAAGIHVRTALTIAKLVDRFDSKVYIGKGSEEVPFDSPLGLLALGIVEGDEITVRIEGADALELASAFDKLVEDNFGE